MINQKTGSFRPGTLPSANTGTTTRAATKSYRRNASKKAPWYVIPADKKWFARLVISEVIVQTMESLKLAYPALDARQLAALEECRLQLLNESEPAN